MKKLALILALCLLMGTLAGCMPTMPPDDVAPLLHVEPLEGEPQVPDTSGLHHYETAGGISFHAARGMKETEIEGMALYMKNTYFLVMVIREPKSGTVLEGMDLSGYAELLAGNNGLEPFVTDPYGTLATVNMAQSYETEDLFFYYVTIHETSDSFWLVQVACPDEMAKNGFEELALWSATFSFPEG